MLNKESILIISDKINKVDSLLRLLSTLEYQLPLQIDIILNEKYNEIETDKLLHVLAYFSQMNYIYHEFNIFISDYDFIAKVTLNSKKFDIKRCNVYKLTRLISLDLMEINGKLNDLYKYKSIYILDSNEIRMVNGEVDNIVLNITGNK